MKKFLKTFANLELAIFLLLLIAFFSGLGSILEQDKPIDFYIRNYPKTFLQIPVWKYFEFLQLDHIYTSWWFFCLLVIFGLCLLSCTFVQQFPALKFARRYYFYTYASQFNKLKFRFAAKTPFKGQVCFRLIQEDYAVFQKQGSFYAYKGLIGRLGPVVVHLSIICILLGSILGALKGFSAQEFVPKSEIFHIQNIVKSGYFSRVPQKAFRVNDFWVNYNKTGLIKQFQSDVSILSGQGEEIKRKTIFVNNPLIIDGLTFYQTDWGISGLRVKLANKDSIVQLPVSKIVESSQKLWVSWLPLNFKNNTGILLVLNNARGKIDFYTQKAEYLDQKSLGELSEFTNFVVLTMVEFISSTGIQIKTDPGIQIIYLGFAFLILSSFISYISFSEIWFLQTTKNSLVGGQSNRAKVKFKIEISKLKTIFNERKG
jgi:cytochrome c biogenesis protein